MKITNRKVIKLSTGDMVKFPVFQVDELDDTTAITIDLCSIARDYNEMKEKVEPAKSEKYTISLPECGVEDLYMRGKGRCLVVYNRCLAAKVASVGSKISYNGEILEVTSTEHDKISGTVCLIVNSPEPRVILEDGVIEHHIKGRGRCLVVGGYWADKEVSVGTELAFKGEVLKVTSIEKMGACGLVCLIVRNMDAYALSVDEKA